MLVPVPRMYTRLVANNAVRLARQYGQQRGWKSVVGLTPTWKDGVAGIESRYKHLLYLNSGTQARLMKELEGRTIPIDGRFVKVKGVGQPGYVTLPGGVKVWRDQKWRHPGIKPTHFIDNALRDAVDDTRGSLIHGFVELMKPRKEIER